MQKIIAAAAASVLLAACGSPPRIQETATSVPQRDLTLSPTITETQVASKIELAVPSTAHRSKRSRTVTSGSCTCCGQDGGRVLRRLPRRLLLRNWWRRR